MVVLAKMDGREEANASSGCQSKTVGQRYKLKQRYEILKNLGQGTYGKVQLAVDKRTDEQVAIKTIKKKKIENDQDLSRIRREINIMSSLNHPHIINIREVFENTDNIIIVMEYASGGELYDYLISKRKLDDDDSRRLFRQIASAIHYCHKYNIVHRDLKLENILLDHNCNTKIADFGLSNFYSHDSLLHTFCGSPLYASPEIVKGTPYHGPEVDCWSLGVLLYTLIYGAMPFDGADFQRLVQQISEGDYYEPRRPSDATGLIRHMLMVSPNRRATIDDICSHWWVNLGYKISLLDEADDFARQSPKFCQHLVDFSCEETKMYDTVASSVSFDEPPQNIDEICDLASKNCIESYQHSSLHEVAGPAQLNTNVPVEAAQELNVKFQEAVGGSLLETQNISETTIMSCDTTPIKSILRRRRYTGCDSGCVLDSLENTSQDDLEIALENTFGKTCAISSSSDIPSASCRLIRRPSKGKYVRRSSAIQTECLEAKTDGSVKIGENSSLVQRSCSWSSTGSSEIIDDGYSETSDSMSHKGILKVQKADDLTKTVKIVETHHVPLKGILKNRRHSLNDSSLISRNYDTLYGQIQSKPKGILKDTNSHGDSKGGDLRYVSNERKVPKGILKNKNQTSAMQASLSMNFVDAIGQQDDLTLDGCSSRFSYLSPPTKPKSILKNSYENRRSRTNRSNSLPNNLSLEQRTCQLRIESIAIDSTESVYIQRKGILKNKQSNLQESSINNEHLLTNEVSQSATVSNLSSALDEIDDSSNVLKTAMKICSKMQ